MDLLKQIVKINEDGLVADAVNFGMMDDEAKNLSLCSGFVFNYAANAQKSSTVGVLECIRRSFHSPSEPNVHLVVQDYGKGKSHFALVLANYFHKQRQSPEVEGILRQVELAVGGQEGILEDLRAHKERTRPYLVIAVSSEGQTDLRQMLLRDIRKRLQQDGVTGSIAQKLCEEPLEYLRNLTPEEKARADQFLADRHVDVPSLIKLLENEAYQEIATVKDISRHLMGRPFDFSADLSVEDILQDLLTKLCTGEQARYQGILLIFDELYNYLQSWATNPSAAGGMTLQNLTNVCENNKGRIALVCFTQVRPSNVSAFPHSPTDIRDYKKLTSRIELASSTYEPMSSLELVLDNLINPNQRARWQEFMTTWRSSIHRECEDVFERCTIYSNRRWPFSAFFEHLGQGTFPLHPVTAYLLCNLDFLQGRTAIQFVKENVKQYIASEPADKGGFLNYLRPIELIDAFSSNLTNHPLAPDYQKAVTTIQASATEDDLKVLKALFLFYVSSGKLKKSDAEAHDRLLSIMCGMTPDKTRTHLQKLSEQSGVIYHFPGTNTYRFYAGVGLSDLKRVIEDEIGQAQYSMDDVATYIEANLAAHLPSPYVDATRFVTEQRLVEDDWRFGIRILTPARLHDLLRNGAIDDKYRGYVAIVVPKSSSEAQLLGVELEDELRTSALASKVIIAIPKQGLQEVAELILRVKALKRKSTAEKERYGESFRQLLRMWEIEIEKRVGASLKDLTLHSVVTDRLPSGERNNWSAVSSVLLTARYGSVAPVEGIDKLRAGHRVGSQIISYMVKQLLSKTLTQTFPNASYRPVVESVFMRTWRILQLTGTQYSVQTPTAHRIKAAWDAISDAVPLPPDSESKVSLALLWKLLSSEPFGYNDLTFTALFGAWLILHRAEVKIALVRKSNGHPSQIQEMSLPEFLLQPELEAPAKFVNVWQRDDLFVIRKSVTLDVDVPSRMALEEAKELVSRIREFVAQEGVNQQRASDLRKICNFVSMQIEQMSQWERSWRDTASKGSGAELSEVVEAFEKLQDPPDFKCKTPEVYFANKQLEEHAKAIESLRRRVRDGISNLQQQASSISSDHDYRSISAQIARELEVLKRSQALHQAYSVEYSDLRASADTRMESLRRKVEYDQSLASIGYVVAALSPSTTQSALDNALVSLERLGVENPEIKNSREYRTAIGRVQNYKLDDQKQLGEWKLRAESIGSKRNAESLLAEITSGRGKYDTLPDSDTVSEIYRTLEGTAKRLGRIEAAEACLTQYLTEMRQVQKRILLATEAPHALSLYQNFTPIACDDPEASPNYEAAVAEAASLRALAKSHIEEQLQASCNKVPSTAQECERVRAELTRSLDAISSVPEFSHLHQALEAAIQANRERAVSLEMEFEDSRRMSQLRRLRKTVLTTLAQCETIKEEISSVQRELHSPTTYEREIAELLAIPELQEQKFKDRLAAITESLREVRKYDDFALLRRSYDQLAAAFVGSRMEDLYRSAEPIFGDLQLVFDRLRQLDARVSSAKAVREAQEALDALQGETEGLPNWTKEPLEALRNKLHNLIAAAENQLKSWQAQLPIVDGRSKLENLRKVISSQSSSYVGSGLEDVFQQLLAEIPAVEELLKLESSTTSLVTESDCERALERTKSCLDSGQGARSEQLCSRLKKVESEIESRRRSIVEALIEDWRRWSANVRRRTELLESEPESSGGSTRALAILGDISERKQFAPSTMPASELADLEAVEQRARAVVNRDRISQIVLLFHQLPKAEQQTLCHRLAQELQAVVPAGKMED